VLSFFTLWLKQTSRSKEFADLQAFKKKLTDRTTRKWDGGYYSEKLKQNYLILTTKIKALFQLEKVLLLLIAQNYMAYLTEFVTLPSRVTDCYFLCRFLSSKGAQRCMDDFV
jgi:Zn-dependent oligopeptidase